MPRLLHAKALLIDTKGNTYETVTRTRSLRSTVKRLLKASNSLSGLRVLVSHTLMMRPRHCTPGIKGCCDELPKAWRRRDKHIYAPCIFAHHVL